MLVTEDGSAKLTPVQSVTNPATTNDSDGEDHVTDATPRKCRIRFADETAPLNVMGIDTQGVEEGVSVERKVEGILKIPAKVPSDDEDTSQADVEMDSTCTDV